MRQEQILVAGGGMGGLAAALACARAGWPVRLFERAAQFREFGAGIQLGPNSTRILREWKLEPALQGVAAFPAALQVRSAVDGTTLGSMRLGVAIEERYGAPYATIHRADLQRILAEAARDAGVELRLAAPVQGVEQSAQAVTLRAGSEDVHGSALIAADGLWGQIRYSVWRDDPPVATGHLAYRGLVAQRELPQRLRSNDVNVWLGPRLHVVAYPVRGGEDFNVVAIVQGSARGPADDWDQETVGAELLNATSGLCAPLRDLVRAVPAWRLWALSDRPALRSAAEMVRGRIALLGDAAHPMRPYLAQGAGMAIEDAAELGRLLTIADDASQLPAMLNCYAGNRWKRCARVQRRSQRNGRIFHATGFMRWARDAAIRSLGEKLLDVPWLYRA
jgi:salicylate hydroxylase